MFTICFLLSCAHVCMDVTARDDGNFDFSEYRVIGYDQKCLNMTLSEANANN